MNQHPNCIVFAFEPSATARSTFLDVHKLQSNVHLEPFGFYNKVSRKTLYSDYPGSAISSLTKRNLQHFGNELGFKEKVRLNTIDNYCQEYKRIPDLLKIDVEGHEMDVLNGAVASIKKIKIIQFEFGGCNIDTRTFFRDFWYFFKLNAFRVYRVTRHEPKLMDQYRESDEYFSTTNYVAVNNRFS